MKKQLLLAPITLLSLFLPASQIRADLLWAADFSSYDTQAGPAELLFEATGRQDTFTSETSTNLDDPTLRVRSDEVPPFMSGNALFQSGTGTNESGTVSSRLFQSSLLPVGSTGVRIISFDLARVSVTSPSLANEARTSAGRSGDTVYLSGLPLDSLRVTIVINRSGSDILLPGGLGSVGNNSLVSYTYNGSDFSAPVSSNDNLTSSDITGFATGISLRNLHQGREIAVWYDNFGLWDDITDSINGQSVLSLPPGTQIPSGH